jgi:hypothetical protein
MSPENKAFGQTGCFGAVVFRRYIKKYAHASMQSNWNQGKHERIKVWSVLMHIVVLYCLFYFFAVLFSTGEASNCCDLPCLKRDCFNTIYFVHSAVVTCQTYVAIVRDLRLSSLLKQYFAACSLPTFPMCNMCEAADNRFLGSKPATHS